MKILLLFMIAITATSCGLDCIDNKTGNPKFSETIEKSKENGVYQFEMISNKQLFHLDSGRVFKIKNAWVEKAWHYECVNNKAVLHKDSVLQFLIDAERTGNFLHSNYVILNKENTSGSYLDGILVFDYSGEDTLTLSLRNKDKIIEILKFGKNVCR